MIRKFDFNKLIERRKSIDELYTQLTNQYSGDDSLLKKLQNEYRILIKLINAGQNDTTLAEAAKEAGTNPDSARRWINGKLPASFAYASYRKINLEKLRQNEDFLFLLGVYQSQILRGAQKTTFAITARDNSLKQTLETCIKNCFVEEAIISERYKGLTEYCVNSKSLMTMIKDLTKNNTTVPTSLFKTRNKEELYYSGFLAKIKITLESHRRKNKYVRKLHASIARSRGDLIASLHQYLDEKGKPHSYYRAENKIRFRGKECLKLFAKPYVLLPSIAKKIQELRQYA